MELSQIFLSLLLIKLIMKQLILIQLFALTFIILSNQTQLTISKETTPSSTITPLYGASIELDDKVLRLNTCIFKDIPIPFTKEQYQSNNIDVIATISETSMDQNFAYHFRYSIICPSNCIIDFALSRFTEHVSQNFKYHLVIDFMIIKNIKTDVFNMTSDKSSFNLEPLLPVGSDRSISNFQVLLIPNGFNNISMTGYIKQQLMPSSDRIIIQYENTLNHEWILNQNFILYKILLIEKQRTSLSYPSAKVYSSFKGFLSTKESQANFNLHLVPSQDNIKQFQLPLYSQFKDERKPVKLKQKQPFASQSNMSSRYFLLIILFCIAELAYLLYRKKYANAPNQNQLKLPQMLISFEASEISAVQNKVSIETKTQTEENSEKVMQLQ